MLNFCFLLIGSLLVSVLDEVKELIKFHYKFLIAFRTFGLNIVETACKLFKYMDCYNKSTHQFVSESFYKIYFGFNVHD